MKNQVHTSNRINRSNLEENTQDTDQEHLEGDDLAALAHYRSLIENVPLVIWRKNLNSQFTWANENCLKMLNANLEDVIGKTDQELWEPTMAEAYYKSDQKVFETGERSVHHESVALPDGKRAYLHIANQPIRDAEGKVIGLLAATTDLSELHNNYQYELERLKEREALLVQAEEQLAQLYATTDESTESTLKVFVSYRHSTEQHAEWVRQFSTDLMKLHSIECILDQFDLQYGDSIQSFMQRMQTEATHVLLILTPESTLAIERNTGGIAFEAQLASALRDAGKVRLIPVLRSGNETPAYVRAHLYIDFRDNGIYFDMLKRLANSILGRNSRPKLGDSIIGRKQ